VLTLTTWSAGGTAARELEPDRLNLSRERARTTQVCFPLATSHLAHDDAGMNTDKTALLFGPYRPPPLQVGERHRCLLRRAEVVVYDWSLAPIPWPLCYHAETRARGKGLLIEDELARAIRHESATAVAHWWGISRATLRNWRAVFGVGRMDTEGSRRLIHGLLWTP
jgi:hypothetical protein